MDPPISKPSTTKLSTSSSILIFSCTAGGSAQRTSFAQGFCLWKRRAPRQEQIGEVAAGDEQHEADGAEQDEQAAAVVADEVVHHRPHCEVQLRVVLRKPLAEIDGEALEIRARLRRGRFAEMLAAAALMAKGYRIVGRHVKTRAGEIDIIARRRDLLIFVEVKARANLDDAAWSVTPRQRLRIAAAAEAWLARHQDARIRDIRFDAILVAPGRIPRHITAAFDTSG